MADEKKSFGTKFLSTTFKIAVGVAVGMAIGPAFADVGTWYPVAHDSTNLRVQAFSATMKPFTGWIPFHMGLTHEPGGFFEPLMTRFIGPELEILENQQEAAENADSLLEQFGAPSSPLVDDLGIDALSGEPSAGEDLLADASGLLGDYGLGDLGL